MRKKIYKKEDLLVTSRNSRSADYIYAHSNNPEKLNILWYKVKDSWINTGDRTCIIGPEYVPTDMDTKAVNLGLLSIDRNAVETNWHFQQIVVGLVIHSGPQMFLLKCKAGDMKDHLTMVQGHVNANTHMLENSSLGDILRDNIIREAIEEVRFPNNPMMKDFIGKCVFDKRLTPRLKFMTYDVVGEEITISKYHIGYIFDIDIPERYSHLIQMLTSNEPKINSSIVYDIRDGIPELADSWLVEIINYYRLYGGYR